MIRCYRLTLYIFFSFFGGTHPTRHLSLAKVSSNQSQGKLRRRHGSCMAEERVIKQRRLKEEVIGDLSGYCPAAYILGPGNWVLLTGGGQCKVGLNRTISISAFLSPHCALLRDTCNKKQCQNFSFCLFSHTSSAVCIT